MKCAWQRRANRTIALATLGLLAACAVGPDFKAPDAPRATSYTRRPLETTESAPVAGGEAQRFLAEREVPRRWWELFESHELNALVEQSLRNNPSVSAAQAALRQAEESVAAQRGFFYPTVGANYSASRQRNPVGTLAPTLTSGMPVYNLYTAQLTVGYAPDVFGANRRAVESLEAEANFQRYTLEATYLTLASNVVAAAVQEAALNEQVDATEKLIRFEEEGVSLLKKQLDSGYANGIDVATQEAALAQARQTLPPLQRALEQTRDLIAALSGNSPERNGQPQFSLAALQLPRELPLTLPAQLVAQRPDVEAALEQMHAASAQIGVAVAAQLPQLAISGGYGGTSTQMSQLFRPDNLFWSIVGSASQTIFDGGTLLHRRRAADAAFDQAAAQYQSVVIAAMQNVADTLYALDADAAALKAAVASEVAARRVLDLNRTQLAAGYVNALAELSAEQTYQQAAISVAQARANRLMDTAALFQSLGGGWSAHDNPVEGALN